MVELLQYFQVLTWKVVSNFKKKKTTFGMLVSFLCLIAIAEPTHVSLYLAVGLPEWLAE